MEMIMSSVSELAGQALQHATRTSAAVGKIDPAALFSKVPLMAAASVIPRAIAAVADMVSPSRPAGRTPTSNLDTPTLSN
jgi:hypothetical protein